jgi:hypothetical protein
VGAGVLGLLLAVGSTPYNHVNRVMHKAAVRVGFQNRGSPAGRMQTRDPAGRRLVYPGWPLPSPVVRGAGAE